MPLNEGNQLTMTLTITHTHTSTSTRKHSVSLSNTQNKNRNRIYQTFPCYLQDKLFVNVEGRKNPVCLWCVHWVVICVGRMVNKLCVCVSVISPYSRLCVSLLGVSLSSSSCLLLGDRDETPCDPVSTHQRTSTGRTHAQTHTLTQTHTHTQSLSNQH